jgi:type IV fimbrial biogenesis protein FimT
MNLRPTLLRPSPRGARRRAARTARGAHAAAHRPLRQAGFTLVELIVAMLVVAVLVGLGVPSFRYVTTANRIAGEINGLLGDMQLARAEAIKEGQTVTVCSSSTPYTACSGSTAWANGWIVFMDANGNKTVDAGEPVLRVQPAFTALDTFTASNAIAAVTFNREGFAFGLPGTVTLALHDPTNNTGRTRCLAITIVGQLQTQSYGQGACL